MEGARVWLLGARRLPVDGGMHDTETLSESLLTRALHVSYDGRSWQRTPLPRSLNQVGHPVSATWNQGFSRLRVSRSG